MCFENSLPWVWPSSYYLDLPYFNTHLFKWNLTGRSLPGEHMRNIWSQTEKYPYLLKTIAFLLKTCTVNTWWVVLEKNFMPFDCALSMILYLLVLQTLLKAVDAKIQVLFIWQQFLVYCPKTCFPLKKFGLVIMIKVNSDKHKETDWNKFYFSIELGDFLSNIVPGNLVSL